MKVVWRLKRATVRNVYESLLKKRRIAYTTVMTMMKILEEKKHLTKIQENRAYVYEPTRPKQHVIKAMVQDFIKRVFDGSAEPLLVHLIEQRRLSDRELDEVRRMIRKHK